MIGALFQIERTIATVPRAQREAVRQEQARPIVDRFFAWCDGVVDYALDDTPLAKAIGYARNQRDALRRFLDDGRLPMHNNAGELRPAPARALGIPPRSPLPAPGLAPQPGPPARPRLLEADRRA